MKIFITLGPGYYCQVIYNTFMQNINSHTFMQNINSGFHTLTMYANQNHFNMVGNFYTKHYNVEQKYSKQAMILKVLGQTALNKEYSTRPGPNGYKTFFKLSSAETKIYPAHKC